MSLYYLLGMAEVYEKGIPPIKKDLFKASELRKKARLTCEDEENEDDDGQREEDEDEVVSG